MDEINWRKAKVGWKAPIQERWYDDDFKNLFMDILPNELYRSILAEDIEEMENLGIIECDDEDFALCSFACPSKTDVSGVIRQGLNLLQAEV